MAEGTSLHSQIKLSFALLCDPGELVAACNCRWESDWLQAPAGAPLSRSGQAVAVRSFQFTTFLLAFRIFISEGTAPDLGEIAPWAKYSAIDW